jgi:zinc protease
MIRLVLTLGLIAASPAGFSQSPPATAVEKEASAAPATAAIAVPDTATLTNQVRTLLHPSQSPLVSFRFVFLTGAASDPAGQEGLAALTAAMISEGGSQRLAYEEILKRMYPLATSFSWQTDKEMTVLFGTTHVDNLQRYYRIIHEMVLTPGFREEDFKRLKSDALNFLRVSLREGNDEELAKEHLYNCIYAGHPYGHHNRGDISALEKLTLDDLKRFHAAHYTQANLIIGVAGGFPADFKAQLEKDFATLPAGQCTAKKIDAPQTEPGLKIDIVQRDTRSTAISIGFPLEVNRAHPDFAALKVVESYFGQHRSSTSHLYQRLREARGLNYGDYAYLEYFPRGMFRFQPEPNLARQEQIFQIWIRPVPPEQALFTFRATLFEYDKLIRDGLTREAFESTREFLGKFVDVLLQTQHASLGYALDSDYYGIPNYREYMKGKLAQLTLEEVNAAIKRHLKSDSLMVVIVTKDAAELKEAILAGKPSPITYNSPKPEDLLAEDKIIEKYPIRAAEDAITITPIAEVFD